MDQPQSIASTLIHLQTSDQWTSCYYRSKLLDQSNGPAGFDVINTENHEVYGDPAHRILFRIGNGGAGYTGILRVLANVYIAKNGGDFCIAWVTNHSRHSQIALLAGVVQVALTYEPDNEELAIQEGWARRVGRIFNDHFILAGPDIDLGTSDMSGALRVIARSHANDDPTDGGVLMADGALGAVTFHTRGDGSATFAKEQLLWQAAEVDVRDRDWIKTHPLTPYDALVRAENEGAFLLTDRGTFLTAKRDGVVPTLHVHVEGGQMLLNPCSALVKSQLYAKNEAPSDLRPQADKAATHFASWLTGEEAQNIVRDYGRQWSLRKPLFTVADEEEFHAEDRMRPI